MRCECLLVVMVAEHIREEKSRVAYEQILQRISKLSFEDLHRLYHMVGERFQRAQEKHTKGQLKQFRVGERVSFEWCGRTIVGIVGNGDKYN